jgi:glycosyltransferase involved in cell wall biosynthesis
MIKVMTILLDEKISGTPVRVLRVCKFLDKKQFVPVVVIPKGKDREFAQRLKDIDISVYEVPHLKRLRYPPNLRLNLEWLWRFPGNFRAVKRIIEIERPNIVHAYGMTQILGPICAKSCHTKLVWHINDDSVPSPWAKIFINLMYRISDKITVSSEALAKHYFGSRNEWPSNLEILYSTVDTELFSPHLPRKNVRYELGIGENEIVIGMIANLHPSKGHLCFLRAAKLLKDQFSRALRFVIVGRKLETQRSYAARIEVEIRRLGLVNDVIMTGYRSDIPDLLGSMDILVVPSVWEPLGVVVMEGMAMQKPVVATNAGGIPEMITNGVDGLLFPPQDDVALAECVAKLIKDPTLRVYISSNARRKVLEKFAPEISVKAYERLYESMMEK